LHKNKLLRLERFWGDLLFLPIDAAGQMNPFADFGSLFRFFAEPDNFSAISRHFSVKKIFSLTIRSVKRYDHNGACSLVPLQTEQISRGQRGEQPHEFAVPG